MVDYSKWKDIEISDDEDDTHPNIDTPSLFRWRHQARVQRMEEQEQERANIEKALLENEKKLQTAKEEIEKAKKTGVNNLQSMTDSLKVIEEEHKKLKEAEEEIGKKEKVIPWNVDTISKAGFSKTVINNPKKTNNDEELTDEQKSQKLKDFVSKNESKLKKFGMLQKYEDSKTYLMDNYDLVCEDTTNYLVIWCINLEMEKKTSLMEHVAHQCICMQYILELSKKLEVDPRACVPAFFERIQKADPDYRLAFEDELRSFKDRVKVRAEQKMELAMKEVEEEERQARLGPGGLDPVEVFESLPKELQECFESQNVAQLQSVLSALPEQEARLHLKRCIDSGLWVPDAKKQAAENQESENSSNGEEQQS